MRLELKRIPSIPSRPLDPPSVRPFRRKRKDKLTVPGSTNERVFAFLPPTASTIWPNRGTDLREIRETWRKLRLSRRIIVRVTAEKCFFAERARARAMLSPPPTFTRVSETCLLAVDGGGRGTTCVRCKIALKSSSSRSVGRSMHRFCEASFGKFITQRARTPLSGRDTRESGELTNSLNLRPHMSKEVVKELRNRKRAG